MTQVRRGGLVVFVHVLLFLFVRRLRIGEFLVLCDLVTHISRLNVEAISSAWYNTNG